MSSNVSTAAIGSAVIAPGKTIALPVLISNVTNATGISLDLTYDPAVASVENVLPSCLFVGANVTTNLTSVEFSNRSFNMFRPDIIINGTLSINTIKGDFNGNGVVDIGDAVKISYYLVGR